MMQFDGNDSQTSQLYKQACEKMKEKVANEEEPYKEKYDARGYLEICLALSAGADQTSILTRALCQHKLGLIAYEVEEFSHSYDHMKKSQELWQILPLSLQYSHAATIQDVYNQIAIVL